VAEISCSDPHCPHQGQAHIHVSAVLDNEQLEAFREAWQDVIARPTQWIRVADRLPEYDTDVHIWAPGWKRVYLGYWRHSNKWFGRQHPEMEEELPDTDPTHWMPLPAPPEAQP
jgi:hypothetical protein